MAIQSWWQQLFATIDERRTEAFVGFLCDDAVFRYGSNAEVPGRAAIAAVVDQVFTTFRASSHHLQRCWEVGDCRIGQGIVTYMRLDRTQVALPFCNVLTMHDNLVARYEIFIDPTPLMSASA